MTDTSAQFNGKHKRNYLAFLGFALGAVALLVVAPAVLSDFRLSLLGRFVCYGIVAVGIGLAWGRGGMLTLGQGVFFGLGGYPPQARRCRTLRSARFHAALWVGPPAHLVGAVPITGRDPARSGLDPLAGGLRSRCRDLP